MPQNAPLRRSLHAALERRAFQAWFQPKVACRYGRLTGFEALARWPDPEQGLIMPGRFIPAAERSGLIGELTRQVFDDAFAWFVRACGASDVTLSLNLSAPQLQDETLPDWLFAACATHGVDPGRIILEITESRPLTDRNAAIEVASRLTGGGVSLSIDDFGVSCSPIANLATLPVCELKIDRSLVATAGACGKSRIIIGGVIALARSLDLLVTAEGVEDQSTLDFLRQAGCDTAQGYFFARPMPGPEAEAWRDAWTHLAV